MTTRELVDLYGRQRFDVLCITDHTVRTDDPMPTAVDSHRWHAYLNELEREAERARRTYGLLLIPGLELTDNRRAPDESAHALAIGLRRHVSVEDGIVSAILEARAAGAAIVAAHPYAPGDATPLRPSLRFFHERHVFRSLVDRWELFNRREIFSWVALHGLRGIATGDFHRVEHLAGWKTLLPCELEEEAVVAFLRSEQHAHLLPFSADHRDVLSRAA